MKSRLMTTILATAVLGAALAGLPAPAHAGHRQYAYLTRVRYHAGLNPIEVKNMLDTRFNGIPTYPGSGLEPGMSSDSPGNFSMVTFNSRKGTVSGIARFYMDRMSVQGWTLSYKYGLSKAEYRVSGAATLTFSMSDRSLSLDITRVNRNLVQYTLISYARQQTKI